MTEKKIHVEVIPQLKDNYSYIIFSLKDKLAIIIDPAESKSIIKYIKKNNLKPGAILLTHHHKDHTAGVKKILDSFSCNVYSPNKDITETTHIIKHNDIINFDNLCFKIFATPGHTLDHVIYHEYNNNVLFSGDTLFRYGCGRVFEGTYKQMLSSLNIINELDDVTEVYCGHEYSLNNLNFLESVFKNNNHLLLEKKILKNQIDRNGCTIPFNLGKEKDLNPFLSRKSPFYCSFMKEKKYNDLAMFTYLRDLKNSF